MPNDDADASAACRHVGTSVDRWIVQLTRFLAGRVINEWRGVRFIPRRVAVLPGPLIVQFVSSRTRRMCARSTPSRVDDLRRGRRRHLVGGRFPCAAVALSQHA